MGGLYKMNKISTNTSYNETRYDAYFPVVAAKVKPVDVKLDLSRIAKSTHCS